MPKAVHRDKASNGRNRLANTETPVTNVEEQRLMEDFTANAHVLNAVLGRSSFLASTDGTVRDIDRECGYPNTDQLTVENYYKPFYDRHAIATRVVEVLPLECWKQSPDVFETSDDNEVTEFEQAWKDLGLSLFGVSKFKQEVGSPIWEYLKRIDVLSGIGFFGVLLIGVNDGKDLREPAEHRDSQELLFLRAFDESAVEITGYNNDEKSPRFGMPTVYSIEFSSPEDTGGIGVQNVVKEVHWSRILHVADNIGNNEVFGVPRMRPVFNRLWDLRKLYGGSAEMYWKGAFPGISIETHPHLGGAATVDTSGLKDALQRYMEGLQRYLTLRGMAAKSLAPQVVDPNDQIEVQLDAICIKTAIPKRIFVGSERGELASSQDTDMWNSRLAGRKNGYITPRIIVPFIDRLIDLGILPEPAEENGYSVVWPDLNAETKSEKATTAIKVVHAMTKYVGGDVEMIMSPIDFLTKIMDWTQEEANQIVESAMAAFEDSEVRDLNRDILEAKALKAHRVPAIPDGVKDELMLSDSEEETQRDALGDKFTQGASGKKGLNKLTKTRVKSKVNPTDDSPEKLEEGDGLL